MTATSDLMSVADAQAHILDGISQVQAEDCTLADSLGRVAAEPLVANMLVPGFDNSAMDGFAIRASDTFTEDPNIGTVKLAIVGVSQAGTLDSGAIGTGQAGRIMTGAPMPKGSDTVVPVEEASVDGENVTMSQNITAGRCVRKAGLDIVPGDVLIETGTRLTPARLALAASVGAGSIRVSRRPRVAILTTGDELIEPGQKLKPGQIYNSNAYGLAAAVRDAGAEAVTLKPARDEPEHLRTILSGLRNIDLLLTAGGVSVGDFDYVKQVVAEFGSVDFWRVRMRPGKPLMMGTITGAPGSRSTPVLGLPGNPTSAMVTFHVFAKPAILKMEGIAQPIPRPLRAVVLDDLDNRGGRETYFRVKVTQTDDGFVANLAGGQDSSMLRPLAAANALARVPYDVERLTAGSTTDVFWFGSDPPAD